MWDVSRQAIHKASTLLSFGGSHSQHGFGGIHVCICAGEQTVQVFVSVEDSRPYAQT